MTFVRITASIFVLALIVISLMGWAWTGAHQAAASAFASHIVLGGSALAGVVALVTLWRPNRRSAGR